MPNVEIILGLLLALVVLAVAARRIAVPYPILLVVGGLALGFMPGLPSIELNPELIFLLFLPPLLYADAWFTSWRDFRFNLRPIGLLAIGLVLTTTCIVAVIAHAVMPELPLAAAFVLGAIVSPTDTVAVTAIAQRLRLPRRIVTILEGESLINDASGLVAYRFAVAAVVTGVFSLAQAGMRFVLVAAGGVLIGLIVGWITTWIERRIDDPPVEITLSFLTPFAAYIAADRLAVSGVLAVVTAGLYVGRRSPVILSSNTRLQAVSVWSMLVFLLNGLIFILIGLQLRGILQALAGFSPQTLIWYGIAVSLTVIVWRVLWVFPAAYLPRRLSAALRARDPDPPWQAVAVIAWCGMRGGVSLAAALALPRVTATGSAFPGRDLIQFLTFCVIFSTLIVQGLSLPPLIRRLGLSDDGGAEREEAKARLKATKAAMARLDELAIADGAPTAVIAHLREHYEGKARRFTARYHGNADQQDEEQATVYLRLQRELLAAERTAVVTLRDRGVINDEVLHRVERDLDLEAVRLEAGD
jgi:CPA1 family monovalent cation:H+ antiporter